jgi:hypothetical protein
MTRLRTAFKWDKYTAIECVFFIFIYFLVPMGSDLEYMINMEPRSDEPGYWRESVIRRLVWGCFNVLPYYLFYKFAIQRLLVKKRYTHFILSLLAFFVLYELYKVYGTYWTITQLTFLPEEMRKEAAQWMQWRYRLHFTVHYMMLELIQITALAYFIHYDKQGKEMQQLKQLQTEADLEYLKAQLQPHFFFNTLNNIYSLALQQSPHTAPLVSRLSDMMRYVLYEGVKAQQPLSREIAFLQDYVAAHSVRYNDKISILFDTQGVTDDAMIAPLLLLPFVENAFKHGVAEETDHGFVEIVIVLQERELTLSVKNSIPKTTVHNSAGLGLENTRKRLALLYPGQHSLRYSNNGSVYEIVLTVNLQGYGKMPDRR